MLLLLLLLLSLLLVAGVADQLFCCSVVGGRAERIVLFLLMLLSCGKHVLDAVVAAAVVQPLDRAVFIDVAVLWQACPGCCCCSRFRSALGSCCFY